MLKSLTGGASGRTTFTTPQLVEEEFVLAALQSLQADLGGGHDESAAGAVVNFPYELHDGLCRGFRSGLQCKVKLVDDEEVVAVQAPEDGVFERPALRRLDAVVEVPRQLADEDDMGRVRLSRTAPHVVLYSSAHQRCVFAAPHAKRA